MIAPIIEIHDEPSGEKIKELPSRYLLDILFIIFPVHINVLMLKLYFRVKVRNILHISEKMFMPHAFYLHMKVHIHVA